LLTVTALNCSGGVDSSRDVAKFRLRMVFVCAVNWSAVISVWPKTPLAWRC